MTLFQFHLWDAIQRTVEVVQIPIISTTLSPHFRCVLCWSMEIWLSVCASLCMRVCLADAHCVYVSLCRPTLCIVHCLPACSPVYASNCLHSFARTFSTYMYICTPVCVPVFVCLPDCCLSACPSLYTCRCINLLCMSSCPTT